MSRVGLEWYKREPVAYLGDVQGLTSKEHAVYAVVIDLLYVHGGTIQNDPKFISGYISDMGSAAVRKVIASLDANPRITLDVTAEEISQKRAKNQAKTKEKLTESARKSGEKGGRKSAENRRTSNENKDLGQADPATENQAEKRREEKSTEIDKSISSQEAADFYLNYLAAHPKAVESTKGETLFSELLEAGEDPKAIIAAAKAYADTVKDWSGEGKVQQSDNFLDPDRGKNPGRANWRDYVAAAKPAPATGLEQAQFWAEKISKGAFIMPGSISEEVLALIVSKQLVTPETLKEQGIAA